jgi:hypothetical protein
VHERVESAIKTVETISREVEQVQRVQGGFNLRIDAELKAGRLAVARATAAAGHADAVSSEPDIEVLYFWSSFPGIIVYV